MRRLSADARRFPDLDLAPLDTRGLEGRDAAFAVALRDAVIRRWMTLSFLIDRTLDKRRGELEPKMRAVLLGGAAQLALLDRVPAHAAIDEAVEWAKRSIRPKAGGMVNAILRRVADLVTDERRERWTDRRDELPLETGEALVLSEEALPTDGLERLSVVTSHPLNLLRRWAKSMPLREVRRLALHGVARPPIILNTAHAASPLPMQAPDGSALLTAHEAPGHHVYHGEHAALVDLLRDRTDIWAQDPASSLAVMSASDLKAEHVLDLCAGRGTKTRQLAATFPDASIVATDIDAGRFAELKRVFAEHPRVTVVQFDEAKRMTGRFDLALLDAPCSNTGVLARRVEARYRYNEARTDELTGIQRQLIADTIPLLRTLGGGGRILYSTCSLDPEENEEICAWADRWHSFDVARENRRPPSGGVGEPPEAYSDGSFAALLA
jgi:16S rRNA (cytosine967-C5)-methyltransferase